MVLRHRQYDGFLLTGNSACHREVGRSRKSGELPHIPAPGRTRSKEGLAKRQLSDVALRLSRVAEEIIRAKDIDTMRGFEGHAASMYFGVFNDLITASGDDFEFRGRSRRPPLDNINALLSFLYTLLTHDMVSALEVSGSIPHRDICTGCAPAAQAWRLIWWRNSSGRCGPACRLAHQPPPDYRKRVSQK